jgi:hypothetical protein
MQSSWGQEEFSGPFVQAALEKEHRLRGRDYSRDRLRKKTLLERSWNECNCVPSVINCKIVLMK